MAFEDILNKTVGWTWSGDDEGGPKVSDYLSERIDLDLAEPDYSFDLVSFWVRKDTGQVLYSTDSGCSCPSPYEGRRVEDLMEISIDGIPALLDRLGEGWGYGAARLKKDARESNLYENLRNLGGK